MRIVYIPLDERPCNSFYPVHMLEDIQEIAFLSLPLSFYGQKKRPADVEKIFDELERRVEKNDVLVVSMDMLLYGGLIPSRLHYLEMETIHKRIERLTSLVERHDCKVYASNVIMRSPTYNSSDEEPDYYAEYGRALHRRAYLLDKAKQKDLTVSEEKELQSYVIPNEVIDDYESRRDFNEKVNYKVLKLLKQGVIDYLVIPQDDAQPYGYTAQSQRRVLSKADDLGLLSKISVYPGADEVGATLCGRAMNDHYGYSPKIYPFYSSTIGPFVIPLYEDRPLQETIKAHIHAIGGVRVETASEADVLLAVNAPVNPMQRAEEQDCLNFEYHSHRNLKDFVALIEYYLNQNKKLIVSDSSFGNGGDLSLIQQLDEKHLLDQILGYSGWNTNGNTLGVALLQGILVHHFPSYKHEKHLFYRLFEDVFYQAKIRKEIRDQWIPQKGYEDGAFQPIEKEASEKIAKELNEMFSRLNVSKTWDVYVEHVYFPWNRCFEIGFDLKYRKNK